MDFKWKRLLVKGLLCLCESQRNLAKKEYSEDLFSKILQFELALCEKPDALALAGHMQAIAYKP